MAAATAPDQPVSFGYNLGGAPLGKAKLGCWSRQANVEPFPVATGISGVLMSMKPGGLRELHWHANAAEWAYVISGSCRITIFDPEGRSQTVDFGPGDVWYFPRGFGHSIQAIGAEDCLFLLTFDSGYFSEYATFSITDWIGHIPADVLAKVFGVLASDFASFPRDEVYFAAGPVPPPLPLDPPPGSEISGPISHRFHLLAQKPQPIPGGSVRIVSSREFPVSTTVTGALMELRPGAVREPHWHPNADEWQFYVSGQARLNVFLSQGRSSTVDLGPGYIGYVPRGCGHYIENIGADPLQAVIVFNSGQYEEISLSSWMAANTPLLLSTNFSEPQALFASFPRDTGMVVDRQERP
jgi:oxalate decarboxylase